MNTVKARDSRRARAYATKYGITIKQYDEMLERQEGVCALCGRPPKTRRLHVDHDHKTGRVRGLLCHFCNRALPSRLTVEWLQKAALYIAEPERRDIVSDESPHRTDPAGSE